MIRISVLMTALLLCCAPSYSQTTADATKLAGALSGNAKNAAANSPLCKLFSKAEASAYIGTTLTTGWPDAD